MRGNPVKARVRSQSRRELGKVVKKYATKDNAKKAIPIIGGAIGGAAGFATGGVVGGVTGAKEGYAKGQQIASYL